MIVVGGCSAYVYVDASVTLRGQGVVEEDGVLCYLDSPSAERSGFVQSYLPREKGSGILRRAHLLPWWRKVRGSGLGRTIDVADRMVYRYRVVCCVDRGGHPH